MHREKKWLLKEKYHGEKSAGFFADCEHLKAGEPLAYIIGHIPFLDVTISLDSRPLIPRPETEHWTTLAIDTIKKISITTTNGHPMSISGGALKVLDLCAGSGAIGVAVAKAVKTSVRSISAPENAGRSANRNRAFLLDTESAPPIRISQNLPAEKTTGRFIPVKEAHVDFAEIDMRLHATIVKNICDNGIDYTTTRVFGGNLFEHIPRGTTYEVILSNPPYIDPALNRAEQSVTKYEPHLALYGGVGGMEIIERIIRDAYDYLAPRGQLWIEHEPEQSFSIADLASLCGYEICEVLKDQYSVERTSVLTRP